MFGGLVISASAFATLVNAAWISSFVLVFIFSLLPGFAEYGARVELLISINPMPEDTPTWMRKLASWHVPKYWFRYFYEWGMIMCLVTVCECQRATCVCASSLLPLFRV